MAASRRAITVLDGGMGHLLRRKGVEVKGKVGSSERFMGVAMANVDNPKLVAECHNEYVLAGAKVLTTNSYAAVPKALTLAGAGDWDSIKKVIVASSKVAREAAEKGEGVKVAGALPPLGPSYRFDLVGDESELEEGYKMIVAAVAPGSDLLLCETMSCVREGLAAAKAADEAGLPIWVAYTLNEDGSGNLRSGESIETAVESLAGIKNLEAFLINCSDHKSTCVALPKLKAKLQERVKKVGGAAVRIGAYANGFVSVQNPEQDGVQFLDLSPDAYLQQAREYVELGADIVGGCCGVYPEHIEAVSRGLTTYGGRCLQSSTALDRPPRASASACSGGSSCCDA